uniref:CC-NBS-LRR resistance-like protein RGC203 n=1 Tax=Helianthus annuus TaxID=4232 RepID=E3SU12_HELAN|nr:CC-NBS-LRR resistance-like protein RGC203 [Helianthus annuus]
MADAGVSALVTEVVGRLTSEVIKEFNLLWGFKNDILTLRDDFEQIQAVLRDAEEKQVKNNTVEVWLKRLRSASLEVENVLDDISTEALLQRLHKQRGIKQRVRAIFSSDHNQLMFRARVAHKVIVLRRKLDAIASQRSMLGLSHSDVSRVDVGVAVEMPDRETSSFIHDSSVIFGRNEEIEKVTRTICDKEIGKHDDGKIRVYGIWGIGGLGKTTLAQLVYSHERVTKCFELRCWAYVSQNFQVKDTVKRIIESIDGCGCALTTLDALQDSLRSKLRGKNFLVVLDDVWIEDSEKSKWDQLSEILSCGAEGSIVVTTTRFQTTSRMMAKVPELQHELGCLSKKESWLLFKKFAFAKGREGDNISELKPIGMEIVEKCQGLPLAVKTLGSLMWSKNSSSDWKRVKDNHIWELQENKVLPALKLSYDTLLPHIKRCFAYCCLFPKGYEMQKDVLISVWVSNDLIPPRGEIDLYVLGEEILNCLVWRSFFQVGRSSNEYKMHDLMHDLAEHVMGDNCLVTQPGREARITNEVLHVSSSCPDEKFQFSSEDLEKLTSLKSIFMFGYRYKCDIRQICYHMYLRVLYLYQIELSALPESICKLTHLKYLNLSRSSIDVLPKSIMYLQNLQFLILSYSSIKVLPESICYLQNLKVLTLCYCKKLCKLPEGLRYMSSLQHLDNRFTSSLMHLPLGVQELTSLKWLPCFPVGNECGAKIGELGDLNLLEESLKITKLDNVGGLSEAKSANLKCKSNLWVLHLEWNWNGAHKNEYNDEKVLEGLEPHHCLKELTINGYMGKNVSPSWMINLNNLVSILVSGCLYCECVPALGSLPSLRSITLQAMDSLKCFHDDNTNKSGDTTTTMLFPSLQYLDISLCPCLESLPSNLPKLKVLRLGSCNELVSLPDEIQSFKDLNELVITDCQLLSERYEKANGVDWPKISHIPNVYIPPPRFVCDY